nr:hypothetical protein [Cellulosimicrobium sp. MM]
MGGVIGSAAIVATLTARLAVTLPAAARDAAASLPEQFRQQFVDGFANAGSLQGGQGGSFDLPPGVPDDVARQVTDAATTAFHQGFATAVGQTLAVTAVVLVLGFVARSRWRRSTSSTDRPGSTRPSRRRPPEGRSRALGSISRGPRVRPPRERGVKPRAEACRGW